MRKFSYLVITFTILFSTCQNQTANIKQSTVVTIDSNIVSVSETQCYNYIKNRDIANLSFTITNGIVIGDLAYKLYEKDNNKGKIEGEMKGDTLMLDYTFSSEGKESTRQVVMLKKKNKLIEGIGEVEEKNGKFKFKNISNLNFEQGIIFTKTDCNKKGY